MWSVYMGQFNFFLERATFRKESSASFGSLYHK